MRPAERFEKSRPTPRPVGALARAVLAALALGGITLGGCVGGEPPIPGDGNDASGAGDGAAAVVTGDTGDTGNVGDTGKPGNAGGADSMSGQSSEGGEGQGGPDASEASAVNSGADSGSGAAPDSASGPGPDGAPDSAVGHGPDATTDSGAGPGPDATSDSGGAPGPDATLDSGSGSGPDAMPDSGTGPVPDAMAEASGCPPPSGTGALGTLGCACSSAGQLACNGNAQPITLICNGGVWTVNQTCSSSSLCDSRTGATKGTCQPIDPACATASPNQAVCSDATTAVTCGPDLVSDTPAATCTSQACVAGACTGVCSPTTTMCTSDTAVETCDGSGAWGAATTCTFACVGTIGTVGGNCGGACVPGTAQCSGNGFETCSTLGQWSGVTGCTASQWCSAGACAPIPSCAPGGSGLTDCGVDLSKPAGVPGTDNCCTSMEVAAGTYYRTYANSGSGPTGEADPATVSGFRLDKYEVTVGRFRQFVTAWNGGAGYTPPAGSGKHTHLNGGNGLNATAGGYETGWVASDDGNITAPEVSTSGLTTSTWTASPGSDENLPINFVNWYDAYAFCIWDGGFLPSEAEWGYAAAGGTQQSEYPWGTTDPGTANLYAIYNCYYPSGSGSCLSASISDLANVGTGAMGAGLWGQLDLAGSVQEWTLDWYAVSYVNPCTDCANLTAASDRSTRGGAFTSPLADILPPFRNGNFIPGRVNLSLGFRCARTP